MAPGAVADWHSHPQHTIYAVTDAKMQVEIKDKETTTFELKAGQAIWSPAVTHRTSNAGKNTFYSNYYGYKIIPVYALSPVPG